MGLAGLDAHDRRDERSHGKSRVHLRRGLLAAVRIAGDVGERELDHGRVDREDASAPEPREESSDPFRRDEARRHFAKMPDGLPVHRLGDFGGPRPVRVRERVALPGRRVAHKRQLPLVQICAIAYLRETRRTGEMPKDEHDKVACRENFRASTPCAFAVFSMSQRGIR